MVFLVSQSFASTKAAKNSSSQAEKNEIKDARENVTEAMKILTKKDHAAVEQELEGAKAQISKNDYHEGRVSVMRSKRELDLAEAAVEMDRWDEARTHLRLAEQSLSQSLSSCGSVIARSSTTRQAYVAPQGDFGPNELQAKLQEYRPVKRDGHAGEASNEKKCSGGCDQASPSGEWMKAASDAGVNEN